MSESATPGPAFDDPHHAPTRRPASDGRSAVPLLAGRVLVHARATDVEPILRLIRDRPSGLVLTGTKGARVAARCRAALGFTGPVLLDPATYENAVATPGEPFGIPRDGLFPINLASYVKALSQSGADAVLTPTGYIRCHIPTLEAVRDACRRLEADAVVAAFPLDVEWLGVGLIDKLIEILSGLPKPKAVMLGGQFNPPGRVAAALANLRRLCTEVPDLTLFRTGLAAFDAMAYGALAAAIGTSGPLRHITPPGQPTLFTRSPTILIDDLVAYVRGSTLADRFGSLPGPVCQCQHCGSRRLTGFLRQGDRLDARLHSVAVWSSWLPNLLDQPSAAARRQYWRGLCRHGIAGHDRYNQRVRDPAKPFRPPRPLLYWAGGESGGYPGRSR